MVRSIRQFQARLRSPSALLFARETAAVSRSSFNDLASTISVQRSPLRRSPLRRSRWPVARLGGTDSHNLANRSRYAKDILSRRVAPSADRQEAQGLEEAQGLGDGRGVSRCVFFVHEPKSAKGAFAGKATEWAGRMVACRSFGRAAKAASLVTEAVQEYRVPDDLFRVSISTGNGRQSCQTL
jgi:hypothetical protein